MATACFEQGAIVQIGGSEHRLLRKIDDCWQLEQTKTGRILEYELQELLRMAAERSLTFSGTVSIYRGGAASRDLSSTDVESMKLRRSYVLAVLDNPNSRKRLEEANGGGSSLPIKRPAGSPLTGGNAASCRRRAMLAPWSTTTRAEAIETAGTRLSFWTSANSPYQPNI